MRPRKLVVRGFTCFRDEIQIDFTELNLFAITGPTGAGKTSLLDAMTFALFGHVYRVEGVRSVISLGVKEARVHFEFSVGPAVYQVTRVSFANKRPSQVALDRALGNGEWEPQAKGAREAEAKISELLGLDFEGFTKAVLLPQNAFSRFLHGDGDERRSILEALLGTEIYERIQKRANQVADDRRRTVELLSQQLARDYEGVTAERVQELGAAAATAAGRVTEMRAARQASQQALVLAGRVCEARRRANDLATRSTALRRECEELDAKVFEAQGAVKGLTDTLEALDREVAGVGYDDGRHLLLSKAEGDAVRCDQIVARLAALQAAGRKRAEDLDVARADLAGRETDLAHARETLAGCQQALDAVNDHARALETRYGTQAAIAVVQQTERQWREDHQALGALDAEIVALEARQAALDADLERLRAASAACDAALAGAQSAQSDAERRATELRDLQGRVSELQRQISEVVGVAAKADAAIAERREGVESADRETSRAGAYAEAAHEAVSLVEGVLDGLRADNAAYVLRSRVRVGERCPVCEKEVTAELTLHPEHSLTEAEAAVTRARKELRTAQEAVTKAAQALTRAQGDLGNAETAKADAQARLEQLGDELTPLLGPEIASAGQLTARRSEADAAVKAVMHRAAEARAAATDARTAVALAEGERRGLPALAEKRAARERLYRRCDSAAAAVAGVCGQRPGEEAAAELAAIAGKLAAAVAAKASAAVAVQPVAKAVHDLELERARLAQHVASEERAASTAEEERDRLRNECESVEASLTAAGVAIEGDVLGMIRGELRRLASAKALRERLLAKRVEAVAALARTQADLGTLGGRRLERGQQRDAVIREAETAQQHLREARDRLGEAVAANEWPGWDAAAAAGTEETWLAEVASEAQAAHDRAVADHTSLSTEARHLAARLELANACRIKHDEALREAEIAGDLGQLLMANRFRSYLLEQAIETLAADGSRHLRELSGGRYTFHTEEAEFLIVDGWNADERRSVKTLSGGETFLASLALALGLAEGLPALGPGEHGHQRLESLFIDEGFGTLDPDETLDIVTQALENLRTDDRIVGIVTHLPQLADRLPAQIRVVKSQVGSHVEVTSE